MEPQTAIDLIVSCMAKQKDADSDYTLNIQYALETAISKIEKDIPKSVITKSEVTEDECREYFACPVCRENIRNKPTSRRLKYRPSYCSHCGQAIAWDI